MKFLENLTPVQKKMGAVIGVIAVVLIILAVVTGGGSDLVGSSQDNVDQVELQTTGE